MHIPSWIYLVCFLAFVVGDLYCYKHAKYPERKSTLYRLPWILILGLGGGYYALWKYGPIQK